MAYKYGDNNLSLNIEQPTNILKNKGQLAQTDWVDEETPQNIENGPGGFSNLMSCMEIDWGNASWNGESINIDDLVDEDGGIKNIKSSYDILRLLMVNLKNGEYSSTNPSSSTTNITNGSQIHVYNVNGINKLYIGNWYLGWVGETLPYTQDNINDGLLYPINYSNEINYEKLLKVSQLFIILNKSIVKKKIQVIVNDNVYLNSIEPMIKLYNGEEYYVYKYLFSSLSDSNRNGNIKINVNLK